MPVYTLKISSIMSEIFLRTSAIEPQKVQL